VSSEVLQRVKEERKIIQKIKRMKANWIGHILHWKCFFKHAIDGKIEVMARRRRRCKQLLNDFTERGDTGN